MRSTRRSAPSSRPCPGSVYRYINAGINVLGAIIRDRIESRGLPYHATLYGLLADRLGMGTYQHSADCAGNFIASGSGFATLRDYAKLGVLYVQDGMWDGERLLPQGWADYALAADTCRQQLRRVLPQQCRPQLPRPAARYRLGVRRIGSAHLHPAPPSPGRGGRQRDRPSDGPRRAQPRDRHRDRGLGVIGPGNRGTTMATANYLPDVLETTEAERLATGFIFTEGPLWHPEGFWYFVDIRRNHLLRMTPGKEPEVVRTTRSAATARPSICRAA